MLDRGQTSRFARGAFVALLLSAVVIGSASATRTAAGAAPVVKKVHARMLATVGTKTSWEVTATALDADGDLVGGQVKIGIGKAKPLSRRIVGGKARTTSMTSHAVDAQAGVSSATLAGHSLRVAFYASPAPGPVTVKFWVIDAAKHASTHATLNLRVKANQTVTIAATNPDAAEPDVAGTFTVTRSGGSNAVPLTVSYTATGTATSGTDYTALPGTVTIPAGSASADITIDPVDDALIEPTESVIVTLAAKPAYIVGTPNAATATITSDDSLPTVSIFASDPAAAEPSSPGTFTVSRSGSVTTSMTVSYTVSGTATAGSDYTTLTGNVTIPAGLTDATITVVPINDTLVESPETVVVTLRAIPTRYTLDVPSTATVTITDDDAVASVSIVATDPAAAEPSDAGVLTVTRTGSTTSALKVSFTLGGTATAGVDYSNQPNTPVTIPAGLTSATIKIVPIDDAIVEPAETAVVTLAVSPDYTVGASNTAMVTIADNEPTVTITATDPNAAEPSDPGTFTVTRTGDTTAALTVFYTVSGTATNGTDYTALSGSVTIPAGQSSVTITVSPIDDLLVEGPETVILTLTSTASYSVGTPAGATVTIADND